MHAFNYLYDFLVLASVGAIMFTFCYIEHKRNTRK